MTKTPRERFEEKFDCGEPDIELGASDSIILSRVNIDGNKMCIPATLDEVWSFIETLLEEARQEGYKAGAMFGYSEGIETCIVSLQGAKESFNKKSL